MTGVVVDLVSYYVTELKVKIISVFQSSVGKKIGDVTLYHNTIPCELNSAK